MRRFDVVATRDPETGYWWGGNDELPLTTEGHTFDEFSERATAIGQEMA